MEWLEEIDESRELIDRDGNIGLLLGATNAPMLGTRLVPSSIMTADNLDMELFLELWDTILILFIYEYLNNLRNNFLGDYYSTVRNK
jgi:hypothetical protein